jgi:CheY-like chemotaxis protein
MSDNSPIRRTKPSFHPNTNMPLNTSNSNMFLSPLLSPNNESNILEDVQNTSSTTYSSFSPSVTPRDNDNLFLKKISITPIDEVAVAISGKSSPSPIFSSSPRAPGGSNLLSHTAGIPPLSSSTSFSSKKKSLPEIRSPPNHAYQQQQQGQLENQQQNHPFPSLLPTSTSSNSLSGVPSSSSSSSSSFMLHPSSHSHTVSSSLSRGESQYLLSQQQQYHSQRKGHRRSMGGSMGGSRGSFDTSFFNLSSYPSSQFSTTGLSFDSENNHPLHEIRETSREGGLTSLVGNSGGSGGGDVVFGHGLSLSSKQIRYLFPYHIALNYDFSVLQMGSYLSSFLKSKTLIKMPTFENIGKYFKITSLSSSSAASSVSSGKDIPWSWEYLTSQLTGGISGEELMSPGRSGGVSSSSSAAFDVERDGSLTIEIELNKDYYLFTDSSSSSSSSSFSSTNPSKVSSSPASISFIGTLHKILPKEDNEALSFAAVLLLSPNIRTKEDLAFWQFSSFSEISTIHNWHSDYFTMNEEKKELEEKNRQQEERIATLQLEIKALKATEASSQSDASVCLPVPVATKSPDPSDVSFSSSSVAVVSALQPVAPPPLSSSSSSTSSSSSQQHMEVKQLIGNVTHDLKTPLGGFLNGIDSLKDLVSDLSLSVLALKQQQQQVSVQSQQQLTISLRESRDTLLASRSLSAHGPRSSKESPKEAFSPIAAFSAGPSISDLLLSVMDDRLYCMNRKIQDITDINNFMTMTINRCIDYVKVEQNIKLKPNLETIDIVDTLYLPLNCMKSLQSRIPIRLEWPYLEELEEEGGDTDVEFQEKEEKEKGMTEVETSETDGKTVEEGERTPNEGKERRNRKKKASSSSSSAMEEEKELCYSIITDKQWLQENLLCLLSNAVKYSYDGEIIVRMFLYHHKPSVSATGAAAIHAAVNEAIMEASSQSNDDAGDDEGTEGEGKSRKSEIKKPQEEGVSKEIIDDESATGDIKAEKQKQKLRKPGECPYQLTEKQKFIFSLPPSAKPTTNRHSFGGGALTRPSSFSSAAGSPTPTSTRYNNNHNRRTRSLGNEDYLVNNSSGNNTGNNGTILEDTTGGRSPMTVNGREGGNGVKTPSASSHRYHRSLDLSNDSYTTVASSSSTIFNSGSASLFAANAAAGVPSSSSSSSSFLKSSLLSNSSNNSNASNPLSLSLEIPVIDSVNQSFLFTNAAAAPALEPLLQLQQQQQHPQHPQQLLPHSTGSRSSSSQLGNSFFYQAQQQQLQQQCSYLIFEIEDHGTGIKEEMKDLLFNPFSQAQQHAGGTGLGLFSLAKRIEALSGYYGIDNRRDGKRGSLFWFAIPYRPDLETMKYTILRNPSFKSEKRLKILELTQQLSSSSLSSLLTGVGGTGGGKIDHSDSREWLNRELSSSKEKGITAGGDATSLAAALIATMKKKNMFPSPSNTGGGVGGIGIAAAYPSSLASSISASSPTSRKLDLSNHRRSPRATTTATSTTPVATLSALSSLTATTVAAALSLPVSLPPLNILVVDDSITITKTVKNALQRKGFIVETSYNGLDAIDKINTRLSLVLQSSSSIATGVGGVALNQKKKKPYDIVLMDLHMPILDGLEATRRIRQNEMELYQNDPAMKHVIIGVSANSDEETLNDALEAGADDFICKPFSMETFINTLRNLELLPSLASVSAAENNAERKQE